MPKIKSMLCVTDARFQDELLEEARKAGKIERNFALPRSWRRNLPECISEALEPARKSGILPDFPFGSDFSETEERLIPALQILQQASGSRLTLARLALAGAFGPEPDQTQEACLARMDLSHPRTLSERAYRALLKAALAQSG